MFNILILARNKATERISVVIASDLFLKILDVIFLPRFKEKYCMWA